MNKTWISTKSGNWHEPTTWKVCWWRTLLNWILRIPGEHWIVRHELEADGQVKLGYDDGILFERGTTLNIKDDETT